MLHYSTLLLLSVISFLYGFFPIPDSHTDFPNSPPGYIGSTPVNTDHNYQPHFKKTVLIVIDALRWDFATPELMPLTMGLVARKGCISKVSVESPTVTLPRIKALTTGSVPQYIDVVRNLASSEILGDSWLNSARIRGLKVVFYGDNTWEKLFPNFFTRSEGTTSFFVWDFTEVDNNVTRNVDLELQRTDDWDIMILHYLGLDHIGHVLGPFSSKMPKKLTEMDEIVHKIYSNTNYNETLILVTGDHGMRDGGGHGGTSYAEVTVPLLAIGLDCLNSSFQQTDIPANLAVLLGLNIPSTSIGTIQRRFLNCLNNAQFLYSLQYNTNILLKKGLNMCKDTFDNATSFHEKYLQTNSSYYYELALGLYEKCSESVTKALYEASNTQDMPKLCLMWVLLLNTLVLLLFDLLGVGCAYLELFGYCCIVFWQLLGFLGGPMNIIVTIILVCITLIRLKTLLNICLPAIKANSGFINTFVVFTCVLHPITFVSTSFIEEEHYYWIFSTVTLIAMLLMRTVSNEKTSFNFNITKLGLALIFIRFSMDLNSTLENTVQNDDNLANILIAEDNRAYHQMFFAFSLIIVFFSDLNNNNYLLHCLTLITLVGIFVLKSASYHNTLLGKLIWTSILLHKIPFKGKNIWILASTLLIKPHNIILIPFALYTARHVYQLPQFQHPMPLAMASYMLSNCFYFLQGHRNSLANVDVSIGYIGLNDYYPALVIAQVLMHTYTFPVLFHLEALQHISNKRPFWGSLIALRALVFLGTSAVTIAFRHHLFVWSVFAPKLFIESVHAGFLFIEICMWYFYNALLLNK